MGDRRISSMIGTLQGQLRTLMAFFASSPYAARRNDPAICDFVLGNPHDMPLQGITDALVRWAKPEHKDWFAYTDNHPDARAAVATSLRPELGEVDPNDVFLTPGTFGALSVSLRVVVDPGDDVVFLSPPWFFYEPMIRLIGAKPVRVTLEPPFDLDVDAIAAAITPKTRAIIVNTPHNPTGRIYPRADLERLADVLTEASERNGRPIVMLSDESYRRIVFDGATHVSPATVYPDTLLLYTYGKTLLAPGERIGYIALPPLMRDREALRDAFFLAQIAGGWQFPNATLQYALADFEKLSIDVGQLQTRRDRLVEALRSFGYDPLVPEGTFYIMVPSPIADDEAYTNILAEQNVFVGPGVIFEMPGWFRLSITASDEMVEKSLPGFEKAIAIAKG